MKENTKKRVLKIVPLLPTSITLGNLVCGFIAIAMAIDAIGTQDPILATKALQTACGLIFLGMVFDVFDGAVARLTHSTSKFGAEMDSLADLMTFGAAPATIVVALLHPKNAAIGPEIITWQWGWILSAAYVSFAALRLARFNVEAAENESAEEKDDFWGLPSPASAGCLTSLVLCYITYIDRVGNPDATTKVLLPLIPIVGLLLGVLMVSRVPFTNVGNMLKGRKPFHYLIIIMLFILLTIAAPSIMVALAFNGYLFAGLYQWVQARRRGEPDLSDELPGLDEEATAIEEG